MKKIIFCQTPFQIIVSLLIREQYSNKTTRFDIVILNMFSGYDVVARKIAKSDFFDNVYVAESKDFIKAKGIVNNIKKLLGILFTKRMIKTYLPELGDDYDEMFCWNYDAFTGSFRTAYSSRAKAIKLNIFDEGFITYLPIEDTIPKRRFLKFIEYVNWVKGMPKLTRENVNAYYLLEPKAVFFNTEVQIFEIDRNIAKQERIKNLIDYIFDASEEVKKYDRKYIILEEALLANVQNVDDERVFNDIIQKVGIDNVLIKLHPRSKSDRFTDKGVKTIGQSGVPFEALALCGDFSEKKLIGISCGTIPTYRMLFGNNFDGYMLFKYIKPDVPWFKDRYSEFWKRIEAKPGEKGIHFPNTKDELYSQLII